MNELVAGLGLSRPGVSKRLRILREAGLVEVRADAQRSLYILRPEPLEELHHWLEPYRRLGAEAIRMESRTHGSTEPGRPRWRAEQALRTTPTGRDKGGAAGRTTQRA